MNEIQFKNRTGWLGLNLIARRADLSVLLKRLMGIGVRAGTSLGLHRKFMRLMEQIAVDREKELQILDEIETVEKRHREMRKRRLLRRAGAPANIPLPAQDKQDKQPARSGLLTLLGVFYLFGSRPAKTKDEKLTPS